MSSSVIKELWIVLLIFMYSSCLFVFLSVYLFIWLSTYFSDCLLVCPSFSLSLSVIFTLIWKFCPCFFSLKARLIIIHCREPLPRPHPGPAPTGPSRGRGRHGGRTDGRPAERDGRARSPGTLMKPTNWMYVLYSISNNNSFIFIKKQTKKTIYSNTAVLSFIIYSEMAFEIQ